MPEGPRPRPHDDAPPVPPIGEDEGPDDAPDAGELPSGFTDETDGDDLLDDRTGESDEIEALEDALGSEDGWTEDSDPDEQDRDEDTSPDDAEYGYTDDTESPGTDEWEEDLLPEGPEDLGADADSGEEGLDEAEVSDAADLEPMPLDEPSEDEDDEDSAGAEPLDDRDDDEAAWQLPPDADPSSVLVHHLGPDDQGVTGVAIAGEEVWAAGGDAFTRFDEELVRVDDPALEGVEVQSVALLPGAEGPVVAIGTVVGGCLVRRRSAGAFEPANGWTQGKPRAAFAVSSADATLWGRTSEGSLFKSDDAGWSWTRLDPPGRTLGVAATRDQLWTVVTKPGSVGLARSDDGGASFAWVALPGSGARPGPDVSLSVVGETILVASEELGVFHSADAGRTFDRWPCPVTLAGALDPSDPRIAYLSLFHAARDEGAIVVTRDAGRSFVTLAHMAQLRRVFRLDEAGDPDGDNRIYAIVVDPLVRGRIHLASAAGVFVIATPA